ncbi:MAG: helix-turn-helix domain-containing protein [Gammaproteobacteria bacterium]
MIPPDSDDDSLGNAEGSSEDIVEARLAAALADYLRSIASGQHLAATPTPLLSIADAAEYLNVSTTTVRNLAIGGKIRSTRVGDRIRFRREWLDEWIDAGGGEVPAPPPQPRPSVLPKPRPLVGAKRRPSAPKPKQLTYLQKIGERELRLLADAGQTVGRKRFHTWHIGDKASLCGTSGRWQSKLERYPRAFMCANCLTALAAFPEADLARFSVQQVYMLRLTKRGETATPIRAGYHEGDGRRTLCGKRDGPWVLRERQPTTRQCFVCEHRARWDARNLDPNILVPRPLTPMTVLIDAEPVDPSLLTLIKQHPTSLDARQAHEPFTPNVGWDFRAMEEIARRAERIGEFKEPGISGLSDEARRPVYLISDNPEVRAPMTDTALQQLPEWAEKIERALALYGKWDKEARGAKGRRLRRKAQ